MTQMRLATHYCNGGAKKWCNVSTFEWQNKFAEQMLRNMPQCWCCASITVMPKNLMLSSTSNTEQNPSTQPTKLQPAGGVCATHLQQPGCLLPPAALLLLLLVLRRLITTFWLLLLLLLIATFWLLLCLCCLHAL